MKTVMVRLNDRTNDIVDLVAKNVCKSKTSTIGEILSAFHDILQEIDSGSILVVERPNGDKIRIVSSILQKGLLK